VVGGISQIISVELVQVSEATRILQILRIFARSAPKLADYCTVAAERGACPGGTVQGAAFGGAKMQNSEIWPLLAN